MVGALSLLDAWRQLRQFVLVKRLYIWLVALIVVAAALGSRWANAAQTSTPLKRCSSVRGYYNVRVRNVTCRRAASILWRARQSSTMTPRIDGFRCRFVSHAPGGSGFPADMVCTKGIAYAAGGIIDGPA
jgi:hypothetical protein